MSEVHAQALHLLTVPRLGTFLTPEGRETLLRALGEVDTLRQRAEKAEAQLADAVAHAKRAQTKLGELREMLADEIADSPAAPKGGVENTEDPSSATPLPTEPAGEVRYVALCGHWHASAVEATKCAGPEGMSATVHADGRLSCSIADALTEEPKNSQQEPEPRDQVAGVEGSTMREGPVGAPEQDREDSAHRLAGGAVPGEGATASPAAAPWARPPNEGQAWHAWYPGLIPLCGDEEARIPNEDDYLAEGVRPRAVEACVDCASLTGWDAPEKLSRPEQPAPPEVAAFKPPKTCAGFNKSATVPCGSPNVSVAYNGKWFCRRHDPTKSKVCLLQGCGRAGRTAKGSPGIWCKEHGENLSAAERTAIARVNRLPEAANG